MSRSIARRIRTWAAALVAVAAAQQAAAQPGMVLTHQKISSTEGGFGGILDDGDESAVTVASLGDLDGDGVDDLAVAAVGDNVAGTDRGAVWILFLDGVPCNPCDMNSDGDRNAFDFEPFLECLLMQPCGDRCDAIAKVSSARHEQKGGAMRHT